MDSRDTCHAVSQENVEIVRQSWKAFADEGLDAMVEFWSADIDWRAIEGAPDDVGEMHGRDAARRYCQDWLDTFDDLTSVTEEVIDIDENRVVGVQHVTGRARLSGVETELYYAVVYELREGTIARVREYADREQALKAVGPAERVSRTPKPRV
jgi:ketosteroid isomerase-like protein